MSDLKPKVFPTQEQIEEANAVTKIISEEAAKVEKVIPIEPSNAEKMAAELMKKNTLDKLQEQIRKRDELMAKAKALGEKTEQDREVMMSQTRPVYPPVTPIEVDVKPMVQPVANKYGSIAEPKWDSPFDMLPLPSKGKLYKNVRPSIKVSYLTGSDENVLTSPNLLNSGDFLEVLINRNLLEPNLRYRDLHVGDRNAILLWLRGTTFGVEYPITVIDELGKPFDTEVDISTCKTIDLGAEPDENGLFDYKLPLSGDLIKFKLLTVGDELDIEEAVKYDAEVLKLEISKRATYTVQKQIVSVNGNSDSTYVKKFVENMRLGDIKSLRVYIDKIESGVDLSLSITSPGGVAINTFLPINLNFFWPQS